MGSISNINYTQLSTLEGGQDDSLDQSTNGNILSSTDDCHSTSLLQNNVDSTSKATSDDGTFNVQHTWLNVAIGWIAMALGLLSAAGIGPMFKFMEEQHVQPALAASWRCQCMIIFLIPLAILEAVRNPKARIRWFDRKPDLDYQVYVHILIAGVGWSMNLLLWIVSLQYISTVKASLISNLHPLLMVVILYYQGSPVGVMDWTGVFIAIVGVGILGTPGFLNEHSSSSESESNDEAIPLSYQLFGAALCFLAAIGELIVILNRNQIKKYVPLMQYTAVTTTLIVIVSSIYTVIFEGTTILYFNKNSLLGWTSPDWVGKILIFGLIVGVFCIAAFNYAMQFVNPLLFSALLLLGPPLTGILSWTSGVEGIPDVYTFIGGAITTFGIGFLTYSEHCRSVEEKKASSSASSLTQLSTTGETEKMKIQHHFDMEGGNGNIDKNDKLSTTTSASTLSRKEGFVNHVMSKIFQRVRN